ncbi:MAG: aminotransferase class I/II-fold pyridoxal phosphate-dependent enzyme [Defluviitaleaceae bacterium]|nr:aminotransferase class I/II-fold pyridoxal phosphate-dependent enzyme [Defluviitaleaceae bacterium]
MKIIELRSDTLTQATPEMREAMKNAVVGDDVYGEDPTINELQELGAKVLGKEAALYVPSGTMGNLAALLTHCKPSEEVMLEKNAHIYYFERGGMASVAGLLPNLLDSDNGVVKPEHIKASFRPIAAQDLKTSLLVLENTHNLCGGTVSTVEDMDAACETAKEYGMKVHVDGARLFNAAAYLKVSAADLIKNVDSAMVCLSKGLCAPVGSLLVGDKDFIVKARQWRSILGGSMRQAGHIAAAGMLALTKMVDRLHIDNENAFFLAEELNKIDGLYVNMAAQHTNLIYCNIDPKLMTAEEFEKKLGKRGVRVIALKTGMIRLVTHNDVSIDDIKEAVEIIKEIC